MSAGRYMPFSPSPSTAPHSPHITSLRSAATAIVEQEKYLSELLAERNKLGPFMPVLPHCYRLLSQGDFESNYASVMLTADSYLCILFDDNASEGSRNLQKIVGQDCTKNLSPTDCFIFSFDQDL